jgi:8-oxo-dGTP pyrophosphatase MutT (NUDIX family)
MREGSTTSALRGEGLAVNAGVDFAFVDDLDLVCTSAAWLFATKHRSAIDAHFAKRQAENPALWNGRVLLLRSGEVHAGLLRGTYFETDFASALAWRDWGFPDPDVRNCFAMAAILSADGAFLLGVMGESTANAGRVYFPAGVPDPADRVGDRVDLQANLARELQEETGLAIGSFTPEPGWHVASAGPRIAVIKVLRTAWGGGQLERMVLANIAAQNQPELCGVRLVRSIDDIDATMPPYVAGFLARRLQTMATA